MGFFKWIRTETDPTSSSKKRDKKSRIVNSTLSPETFHDEGYSKALNKFNEWRKQKQLGTLSIKNQKHFEKLSRKLEFIKHKKNTEKNRLPVDESIINDNYIYEEIGKQLFSQNIVKDKYKNKQNKDNTDSYHPSNLSNIDAIKDTITKNTIIYENKISESETPNQVNEISNFVNLCNKFQYTSSHPLEFCRPNSNVFEKNENKTTKDIINKQNIRSSLPLYQTIINKHGDEVEYALPFSSPFVENGDEVEYALPLVENEMDELSQINQSDSIFNGKVYKRLEKEYLTKNSLEVIPEKSNYEVQPNEIKSVIVTDLDKSDEKSGCYKNIRNVVGSENIIKELETLEQWSKSIDINVNTEHERTVFDENFTGVISCPIAEVKITADDPIQLIGSRIYPGSFRGALISQQKKEHFNVSFQDEAILLNFEKLRCFRHPDIALLMGVTLDSNKRISSLILDTFVCSLNDEIHKTDNFLTLNDVIKYSIQLTRAAIYCHENGLIHSNICSKSILLSSNKYLKLSSFELATKRHHTRNIENCEKEIVFHFLPHFINYRKKYSSHYYQPPELITTKIKFIFPTKQSDIYGICLTLWEMLNKTIPFAFFNYQELEDLFYLQKAMLPITEVERSMQFKYILEKGLQINPEKRIESAKHLQDLLMKVSEQFTTIPLVYNLLRDVRPSSSCRSKIYDKTSTIKKNKTIESNLYECTDKIKNISNYKKPNLEHNDYKYLKSNDHENVSAINDFHLPTTPIARNNQLLKTAWLSEEKISPIQKPQKSRECSNTKYNVKIKIFPNDKQREEKTNSGISELPDISKDEINNFGISNQINYWNSISSPEFDLFKIKKENKNTPSQFINNNAKQNMNMTDSIGYTYSENNQLTNPMEALLKESLGKQSRNSTISFETSLWKKEKKICQNSDTYNKQINSVKDTVNKFESFSNKFQQYNRNSKIDLYSSKDNTLGNGIEKLVYNKPNTSSEKRDIFQQSIKNYDITQTTNLEDDEIKITSMELKSLENCSKQKLYESKLDIVLDNKSMENPLVTFNLQNINRRSADINWLRRKIILDDDKKVKYERHSICGTELITQLGKLRKLNLEKVNNDFSPEYNKIETRDRNSRRSKDYKIQVSKLICWNCGCKIFAVNELENENMRLSENNISSSPVTHYQNSRSTEDIYIDDDFYQDVVVGANMELGTESELYNLFDFNLLSSDIFHTK